MSPIILYSNDCPRCHVLESKLDSKKIKYQKISDINEMRKMGLTSAPTLKIDNDILDFTSAIHWVNSQEEVK